MLTNSPLATSRLKLFSAVTGSRFLDLKDRRDVAGLNKGSHQRPIFSYPHQGCQVHCSRRKFVPVVLVHLTI